MRRGARGEWRHGIRSNVTQNEAQERTARKEDSRPKSPERATRCQGHGSVGEARGRPGVVYTAVTQAQQLGVSTLLQAELRHR